MLLRGCLIIVCIWISLMGVLLIWQQRPDSYLHVVVCDIGQGDAILLSFGFTQMLIDAGPDEKVLSCLREYMPFWDRHLEFIVATHADQDHIGGMTAVLSHFSVGTLVLTDQSKQNAGFLGNSRGGS